MGKHEVVVLHTLVLCIQNAELFGISLETFGVVVYSTFRIFSHLAYVICLGSIKALFLFLVLSVHTLDIFLASFQ